MRMGIASKKGVTMPQLQGRLQLFKGVTISAAVLVAALTAQADRYIVVTKSGLTPQHFGRWMETKKRASAVSTFERQAWSKVALDEEVTLINGTVLQIEDTVAERIVSSIEALPGVEFVEKEIFYPAPQPVRTYSFHPHWSLLDGREAFESVMEMMAPAPQVGPKTPYGISLVKAPDVWRMGYTGAGSRVLVLDTGIDRDHPALKPNYEKGRDFVGDTNNPYAEADQVGHGTHVAGTIAAASMAGGFVGVAPRAKILMGRVCNQGCSSLAVVQGLQWGVEEQVHVISLSLGGPLGSRAEKAAVEAAHTAGITVVAASGNDGKKRVSFPAAFPTTIAVGAVNSRAEKAEFSNWGKELDIVAPGVGVVSAVPQGSGKEVTVKVNTNGLWQDAEATGFAGAADALQPLDGELVVAGLGKPEDFNGLNLQGKIALVQRGEISFGDKARNAIAVGAKGIVIYNNQDGLIQGSLTQDGSILSIPAVMITKDLGEQLAAHLRQGRSGLARIQTVKTDYAPFDGTSMATPHVSGVVALLKSAKPNATPDQIREALKKTARPLQPNDENQVGAGLVDAEAAVRYILSL